MGCGVAASAPEAGGQRDLFFKVQADAILDSGRLEKTGSGAVDEIARVGRQAGFGAGEFYAPFPMFKGDPVKDGHLMHDCLQFMETVRPLAEDVKQQVDFARGLSFQPQCVSKMR